MAELNGSHAPSYGSDALTEKTIEEMKKSLGATANIFFVFNGTAANVLCLQALIESYQAVVCAETAHLHLDECGAPEKTVGCKVLTVPTKDGKIQPEDIEKFLIRGGDQHYAQPRLVTLTQPTEYGTIYSLDELRRWRDFTKKHNMLLHIDGARLLYAAHTLNCSIYDLTGGLGVDAVSLGGTKNGLLFGEAVVIYDADAACSFKFNRKQMMQLPSKMRFLAAQFHQLINKELWREITAQAHDVALYLRDELRQFKEIEITQEVQANSVFAKFPKHWIKALRESVFFYVWDESTFEVRLMVSFDVQKHHIDQFINCIQTLREKP
jgi:threonine aldolase